MKKKLSRILELDRTLVLKYNGYGGKFLTFFLKTVSFLGRETIWLFNIGFFLFIWYNPILISHFGTVFLFGLFIVPSIKGIIKRLRPFEEIAQVNNLEYKPTSSSFPSWHAYNIMSQGLMMVFLINSTILFFIMIIFIFLVCFSRVQLGVHYPLDVIAGLILGLTGFIASVYLLAPIIIQILNYVEILIPNLIFKNQLNPLLFLTAIV